ncbi:Hypothetical predicted protein, partial [Paramuricea clavata]
MGSVHSEVPTVSDATTMNPTSGLGGGAREDYIANSPSTQQHPVKAARDRLSRIQRAVWSEIKSQAALADVFLD